MTLVLADTSVWVGHFRRANPVLQSLVATDQLLCHQLIVLELACGTPPAPRERTLGDFKKLQQAFRVIEQDIELIQPRPVRDLNGNSYLGAVYVDQNALAVGGGATPGATAAPNGVVQLSFTRGGYANPAGLPRSELQRVSYLVRDGRLIRQQVPVLDATPATAPEERELIDQVEVLGLRYMDESQAWSQIWPTPPIQRQSLAVQLRARPIAVEVTLRLKDYGVLTRIFEVIG